MYLALIINSTKNTEFGDHRCTIVKRAPIIASAGPSHLPSSPINSIDRGLLFRDVLYSISMCKRLQTTTVDLSTPSRRHFYIRRCMKTLQCRFRGAGRRLLVRVRHFARLRRAATAFLARDTRSTHLRNGADAAAGSFHARVGQTLRKGRALAEPLAFEIEDVDGDCLL